VFRIFFNVVLDLFSLFSDVLIVLSWDRRLGLFSDGFPELLHELFPDLLSDMGLNLLYSCCNMFKHCAFRFGLVLFSVRFTALLRISFVDLVVDL